MTKLLKTPDVMEALGVSRSTLWRLVRAGTLPKPIKLGAANRWHACDIEAAVEALRSSPKAA